MGIPLGVFESEVGGGLTRFHGGKGGEVEGKREEGDKEVVHLFTIPRNIGWSRGSRFAKRPQGLLLDAEPASLQSTRSFEIQVSVGP